VEQVRNNIRVSSLKAHIAATLLLYFLERRGRKLGGEMENIELFPGFHWQCGVCWGKDKEKRTLR